MADCKRAIVVTSFGTSYNENRAKTIEAIERQAAEEFPGWDIRRAFTSRMIIKKILERDGERIDYISDAMERLVSEGYGQVVVQPTHIMNGTEYDDVVRIVADHCGNIPVLRMGKPLLTTTEDYDELVEALEKSLLKEVADDEALVLMGHGSEHYANATYSQLQIKLWLAGHDDVFVTTVEGYPEFDDTIRLMEGCGKKKAVLFPLMVVAGDHANNDMAGDEDDSLKSTATRSAASSGAWVSTPSSGSSSWTTSGTRSPRSDPRPDEKAGATPHPNLSQRSRATMAVASSPRG